MSLSWIVHMPECLREHVPSDLELRKISRCFKGDFNVQKRVFLVLGFLDGHIHRFSRECSLQSEVILRVLFAWKYETYGKSVHTPVNLHDLCLSIRHVYPTFDDTFDWLGMMNIVGSILLQKIAEKSVHLRPNECFKSF